MRGKGKYITLLLAAAFAAGCGIYIGCSKPCPTQPPPVAPWHNPLQLKATQVSIRWAQLEWHNDSIAVSHYYVLLRNNKDTVYADSVNYKDSVVTVKDSGLTPGTPYTYTLYRVYNKQNWDTASVGITTLAITSPNMTTKGYAFGGAGSYLRGIWASSPTDVWACGIIDSSQSGGGVYNVIHYDGSAFRLGFEGGGGSLEGVYGVDSGDVWFCGGNAGTYVEHLTHGQWTEYNISGDTTILGNKLLGQLYGIYATPDKQWVYTVSVTGHILRLNRTTDKWEDMPNPANGSFGLRDVVGFGDNDIYTVGVNANSFSIVIHWDGTQWTTLTQSSTTPNGSTLISGNLNGIGGYSPDSLYIVGDSIYHRSGNNWLNVSPFGSDRTFSDDISATAWNRVFVCGDGQLLYWNGEQWYYENPGGTTRLERVFALGNIAYIVGWDPAYFGIVK